MIIESNTSEETYNLGRTLGEKAVAGEIYCLEGDLGVGKTVFTKGFAEGLGIEEHITSPTFTIVNEYKEGRLDFYHFDVYRIEDPYELDEIGFEEYIDSQGVIFIEWASKIKEILPTSCIWIEISKDLERGLDFRKIEFKEK